ncbi:MAG TPA: VOC family protein [Acidimicrobiia bacterium]|jgi:hypothetical protein|nr:VOC family protein [Acidimicrobiia bacterium]
MKPVTIVYVTDMDVSLGWYRRLLPHADLVTSSPYWSELSLGDAASLALHRADSVSRGSQLGLALTADRPLEAIHADLAARGVEIDGGFESQPFGRSMLICDPDGLAIQINEHAGDRDPSQAG